MLSTAKSRQAGKKLIQILFFFIAITQICFAQWVQTNGPSGTYFTTVYGLACSGINVFAGTNDEGVFHTTDNGINWTAVNNGLPSLHIFSLNILGNDIFVTNGIGGVFLSTDYGVSWSPRSNGLPYTSINCFAESDNNVLVGTSGFGVYVSSNYGIDWIEANNGLPSSCSVFSLTTSGTLLFAGVWDTGVFVSTDNGSNWVQRSSGLTIPMIYCFAVSGTDVYAGTAAGVYLTTNNGDEWNLVNNGLTNTIILSFAVSGENILAGTQGGGVFLTQNKGANWNAFNSGLSYMQIFSMTVSDDYIFAGTFMNGGVWRRSLTEITSIEENSTALPSSFNLSQNYPNPFNPSTKISWQSPISSWQTLKIYDILGNEVATLVDEYKPAGSYEIEFDALSLTTGVYFYQLLVSDLQSKDGKAGSYIETKKMILLK